MDKLLITIDGQNYWFKIGLRAISYLQSLSYIGEGDIIVAGLINEDRNNLTVDQAKQLSLKVKDTTFLQDFLLFHTISADVRGLYSLAVGEIGIAPDTAIQMAPDEIKEIYGSYLHKKEQEINLIRRVLLDPETPISLVEPKEFVIGSPIERAEVFK